MLPPKAPADDDPIAGRGAFATKRSARGNLAEQSGRDDQGAVPTVGVAAGNGQIVLFGQGQDAFVKLHGQLAAALARQGDGQHGSQGPGGHGRQIAEVHRQGLAAHAARIDLGQQEVDPLGEQIDRDHALVDAGHPQHGRIVAGPQAQQRVGRKTFAEPGDELLFHNVSGTRRVPHSSGVHTACAGYIYGCRATFRLTGMKP